MPNPHTLNHCLFAKLNYCLCPFLPSYSSHNHPPFPSFSHAWLPAFPLAGTPSPAPAMQNHHRQHKPIPLHLCSGTLGQHGHRDTEPAPAASRAPLSSTAPPCRHAQRWERCLFSPEQRCALGISAQNAAPLNPVNIGRSCLPAGHRDGCWTGQSQHLTSSPAEELGDESPGCTAARGESRPTDLQCPPTQPASLQFVHGVQRRWAPKRMLN